MLKTPVRWITSLVKFCLLTLSAMRVGFSVSWVTVLTMQPQSRPSSRAVSTYRP